LVGIPKIGSRTLRVAEEVTGTVAHWLLLQGVKVSPTTLDIATFASGLCDNENDAVKHYTGLWSATC
jgi:hypothetical protein